MLPRKIFDNLHTVVTILVFFEQFFGKFCLNFLPLNLSVSPNIMHLVRKFSIIRAVKGIPLIVIEKIRNYGKIVFFKSMFENGWWGMHSPLDPPLLITILVWLQYDVGQILSPCFEITACSALAQLRVCFKGPPPNLLPWCDTGARH